MISKKNVEEADKQPVEHGRARSYVYFAETFETSEKNVFVPFALSPFFREEHTNKPKIKICYPRYKQNGERKKSTPADRLVYTRHRGADNKSQQGARARERKSHHTAVAHPNAGTCRAVAAAYCYVAASTPPLSSSREGATTGSIERDGSSGYAGGSSGRCNSFRQGCPGAPLVLPRRQQPFPRNLRDLLRERRAGWLLLRCGRGVRPAVHAGGVWCQWCLC